LDDSWGKCNRRLQLPPKTAGQGVCCCLSCLRPLPLAGLRKLVYLRAYSWTMGGSGLQSGQRRGGGNTHTCPFALPSVLENGVVPVAGGCYCKHGGSWPLRCELSPHMTIPSERSHAFAVHWLLSVEAFAKSDSCCKQMGSLGFSCFIGTLNQRLQA
jgi:hypothetical protein